MICPICKSSNISNENRILDIWESSEVVSYCNNCECYFLKDIPKKEKIDEYYKNEYHHHSRIINFIKYIFRKFRSANQFEYIKSNIKNLDGKKILEIGACDGLLLSYFKNNKVTGLEYSPIYKKIALKKFGINLLEKNFFDLDEKFDFIIMSHVIEHLLNLDLAIDKLRNLLNEDGFLFIEVPNSPKPKEREMKYINNYLTTPHIINFTKKSLHHAFLKHDFKVISSDRFFYSFPEKYSFKKQEDLAELFLKGSGIKFSFLFSIIIYLFKNILKPSNSYKKLGNDLGYIGLGDNIRIILKK